MTFTTAVEAVSFLEAFRDHLREMWKETTKGPWILSGSILAPLSNTWVELLPKLKEDIKPDDSDALLMAASPILIQALIGGIESVLGEEDKTKRILVHGISEAPVYAEKRLTGKRIVLISLANTYVKFASQLGSHLGIDGKKLVKS